MSNVSSVAFDGYHFTVFPFIQNKHHETYVRRRMGPCGQYTLNVKSLKNNCKDFYKITKGLKMELMTYFGCFLAK